MEVRQRSAPIPLRQDFDASQLRGLAKKTKDGPQARRLLALAALDDGAMRTEAAKIGGVGLQIIRDWVIWFNAHGPDGLRNGKSPGQPSKLNDAQRLAIVRMIESGPIPGSPRRGALAADRSGAMDLRGVPHHDRQADAQPGAARHGLPQALGTAAPLRASRGRDPEDFKKASPRRLDATAREKALDCDTIEIWFSDEARIGQKNKITRRWAKRGTRPSAPRDQRTASTYIFGAVCPKEGKGAALILPTCNTEAMNLHLAEIAAAVAPGAHAVLLVDQAGWHMSKGLVGATQHHHYGAATEMSRAQSGRKRLAVPARQPGFRTANPPNLTTISSTIAVCGMEQAHRSALAHHVHRVAPMGPRVLISGILGIRFQYPLASSRGDFGPIRSKKPDLARPMCAAPGPLLAGKEDCKQNPGSCRPCCKGHCSLRSYHRRGSSQPSLNRKVGRDGRRLKRTDRRPPA